jgi:16S rRNA (cytosine1402-N4)-methyltransferase
MATQHVSVLPDETLQWLDPQPGQTFIDGTLGGAGHTCRLAELVGPTGHVISLDADPRAIERCQPMVSDLPVTLVHSNFRDLVPLAAEHQWPAPDGVLLDLGLSSDQLADAQRGFSFLDEGPLDLRFDDQEGESASDLLNRLRERDLADVIYKYGEERASRRIARVIVQRRSGIPQWTSSQLADLVASVGPRSTKNPIHPATRTFQALRIAVNGELDSLELALRDFPTLFKPGTRFAIISFHSLEDRLVKQAFRDDPRLKCLTRKPVRPSDEELAVNSRSRSARLRVAMRVDDAEIARNPAIHAPKRSEWRG